MVVAVDLPLLIVFFKGALYIVWDEEHVFVKVVFDFVFILGSD